jgi:toxin ParE1/3/4
LAVFPGLGRIRDDVGLGLRSYPVSEHVVWYRVEADMVVILRIVHARMDIAGLFQG